MPTTYCVQDTVQISIWIHPRDRFNIILAANTNQQYISMSLDAQKAFDTVNNETILRNILFNGVTGDE